MRRSLTFRKELPLSYKDNKSGTVNFSSIFCFTFYVLYFRLHQTYTSQQVFFNFCGIHIIKNAISINSGLRTNPGLRKIIREIFLLISGVNDYA